jgi:ubiquitin C-terminal hydrolase
MEPQPSKEDVAETPSPSPLKGYGGLVNMGLTCYANATIQCLRHTIKLPWLLEEGKYNTLFEKEPNEKRQKKQELVKTFAQVVQLLAKCERGQSVRPADFWNKVKPVVYDTMYEHLAEKAPHDSHEFYLFLLETVNEALATEVEMRILRSNPSTPEERLIQGALESWQREFSKEYSPIVDMFYGLGHWRTTCEKCSNVSHRWESFNSLKVSVPPGGFTAEPKSILELLEAEKRPETIEEYQCDTCAAKTTAHRSYSVWRLPQTVVLVLKRFTPQGLKIHTPVAPLKHAKIDFASYFSKESPEREGITTYNLRSIIDHHGSSAGGHYTAQAKHRDDEKFYLYDDEGVQEMPGGKGPIYGDSTYMLFLERA